MAISLFKPISIDMLHGSLWDKLCIFALPLALTGVMQQMFNAADVAVLGHYIGNAAIAGVGNSVPIIGLVISLFMGISIGANVVVARYIGMSDPDNANEAVHTSMVVAVFMGLGVTAIGYPAVPFMIEILGVPPEVSADAEAYLRMFVLGMPFIGIYNFEAALLRAKGDTSSPLWALAVGSIFNVAANLVCVSVLDLGTTGVAISTSIANAICAAILFFRLTREQGVLRLEVRKLLRPQARKTRAILTIGVPAGIQGMVFSLSNLVIQSAINSLGAEAMAASAAAFTIEINVFCVLNSFGLATTTFIGQNYGAGNLARCRQVTKVALWLNLGVTALISSFIILLGRELIGLFTENPDVVEIGMIRIIYVVTPQLMNVGMEILSGSMRGYGYSLPPALATLISICGVRIFWVYTVFEIYPTYTTLMIVYPVSWAVCLALLYFIYLWHQRSLSAAAAPKS